MDTEDVALPSGEGPAHPSEQDAVPGAARPIKRVRSVFAVPEEELAPTLKDLEAESTRKFLLRMLQQCEDRSYEDAEHMVRLEEQRDQWRNRAHELEKRNIGLALRARISLLTTLAPSVLAALGGAGISGYFSFAATASDRHDIEWMIASGIVLLLLATALGLLYKADAAKVA